MSGESYLVEIFLPLADNLGRGFPQGQGHLEHAIYCAYEPPPKATKRRQTQRWR